MIIGTTFRLTALVIFAFTLTSRSQGVILNAGDTWSYHFSTLDYVGTQSSAGLEMFSFTVTTLSPNYSILSYRLFEGQPSDGLIYSGGYIFAGNSTGSSGVNFLSPAPWQDLEGSVTFSTSRPLSIDSLTIQIARANTTDTPLGIIITSYDIFATTVTVPEPTMLSLLATAVVAFGIFRFLIRKPQPIERTGCKLI